METLNLNLIPGEVLPVAHASQFDVGRTIRLNLFNGSSVYTLTSEDTLTLNAKKPDGTIITTPVTNTQSTYVDITTTEQLTACYGKVECEIGINTIGTLNFIISIRLSILQISCQTIRNNRLRRHLHHFRHTHLRRTRLQCVHQW